MNTKVLNGAIIGFGFISTKGHLPAYLERAKTLKDVEIIAVADICEERRALASKLLPQAKIYSDYKTLLDNEKTLSFVDISTPPSDHFPIAIEAFKRGLHVLCEKPLTTKTEESLSLLKAAKEVERVLYPCHNYKHSPIAKTIRSIIDSDKIGKVTAITLGTYRNTHAKGVTEWNTHWRRQRKYSGGGIAMDHGSHSFYLMFDWLNSYPTSIAAKTFQLANTQYDTEDTLNASLEFPTGLAACFLTWTSGVRKVIYTIQGTKGAITVDDDNMELALMVSTNAEDVAQGAVDWKVEKSLIKSNWMDASHVSWFNSLFDSFKSAIENKDYTSKDAREAVLCIDLINKLYQSSQNGGQSVQINMDELIQPYGKVS